MRPSRFNIVTKVHDSPDWLVVNLLSGSADLLAQSEANRLTNGELGDARVDEELAAKGYLVDPDEEQGRYRKAYLAFLDARESDEVQLFYVPTYACNFGCSYCYQDEYGKPRADAQDEVISAFFGYVDATFGDRRKYVTLFGGEPLLPNASSRAVVERMVAETARRGLDLAVVTNGFHLASFVEALKRGRIREVQVTLDGTERVHDQRRYLKGGGSTFRQIVEGVDAALATGLPVNLRTVLDRTNVDAFGELAHFAIDAGWVDHPGFKTQIGRNYELHHCQVDRDKLYSRLSLYEDLFGLARRDPEVLRFHQPAFSVARHLFTNEKLPEPLFDACPGCKTEWAFDYTGRIYPCTANVGKEGESVGTFHPTRSLDASRVAPWEERDVLGIEACKTCEVQLACGGGCGAVAKNLAGTLAGPDCRPIRELLSLGAALYGPST